MEALWLAFIPLFVALDAIGLVPVYWSMARPLSPAKRRQAVFDAVITAFFVSVGFLLVSRSVFALLGLELSDIMVAGGVILIVLCLRDLLMPEDQHPGNYPSPGVVPLGVPLLAGPAVLTTMLLVRDQHGWSIALVALAMNMMVVWVILSVSETMLRWLGQEGAAVISKIFSLILTAYGVMLIRRGLLGIQG
jgi:multiple antibiotic resistance protein